MTTRGVVDVVFCLDASASMSPCIEAVKAHIAEFVAGLASPQQQQWDIRLDFVAHRASQSSQQGTTMWHRSALHEDLVTSLYGAQSANLFVKDLDIFRRGLSQVGSSGNEATLMALDCCLDFPWRPAQSCHRVVILLTDEPVEGGVAVDAQVAAIPALIAKIQALRVMLFIVAPQSRAYEALSAANHSEYTIAEGSSNGLSTVDFREVLGYIGKSVSASQTQGGATPPVARALFGQTGWRSTTGGITVKD